MHRSQFHQLFKTPGPIVTPVIHVLDQSQVETNIMVAVAEGAAGVFLINHDFGLDQFLPIIENTRQRFPEIWIGLNFLGVTGKWAFPILGRLALKDCAIDSYWADDARINEQTI